MEFVSELPLDTLASVRGLNLLVRQRQRLYLRNTKYRVYDIPAVSPAHFCNYIASQLTIYKEDFGPCYD
jgi:hypothetical protein